MSGRKKALDERQINFLSFYLNPKSETFMSVSNSALKANYTQSYADNLTSLMPDWLSENIGRRKRLLEKAERNLEAVLDLDEKDKSMIPALLGIKHDASKFVAETVGKEYYKKAPNTIVPIQINISQEEKEQAEKALNEAE